MWVLQEFEAHPDKGKMRSGNQCMIIFPRLYHDTDTKIYVMACDEEDRDNFLSVFSEGSSTERSVIKETGKIDEDPEILQGASAHGDINESAKVDRENQIVLEGAEEDDNQREDKTEEEEGRKRRGAAAAGKKTGNKW